MTVVRYAEPHENATDPNGATGQVAHWLADFTLDHVPENVIERAKDVLLDGVGCLIVGAQLPWSRTAVAAISAFEGDGDSPVLGWDRTLGLPAAALLNSTFIQGFELDDFHPLGPLHSASIVIPALVATATALGDVDGRSALTAVVAGFEIGPRVGMALHGAQMLSRGWHSGAVFGTHAAAATTGVLLGLDPARFEDALGLAGTQSGGLMAAQYEAMSKRMHHGLATRAGVSAAMLARGGYTGIKRVFERDYGGFLSVFGEGHDPDVSQVSAALGERWETLRIALKPYAAMGALHGPLDAILAIRRRRMLDPAAIVKVDIYMSHAAYHHGWWKPERPLTPIGAQMNVGYAVTAAILDGAAMVAQFAPQRIDRDDIWSLIDRVEAHHDEAYDGSADRRGACRVEILFHDGTRDQEHIDLPRTVGRPLDRAETIAKFNSLTNGLIEEDRREALLDATLKLEMLKDVREWTSLLRPTVGAAFS